MKGHAVVTSIALQLVLGVIGSIVAGAIVRAWAAPRRVVLLAATGGALAVLTALWLAAHARPSMRVQIGEPKDGAAVGYQPHIKGTVSDAAAAVHVLVRPITSEVWWVQNAPVVQPDGTWEVPVYIGTAQLGVGESYEIVAVAASGNWFLQLLRESSLEAGQKVKALPEYLVRSKVLVVRRL